ncbi:unnamed protein product [Adineta ricciae]|uniref:Uncharacterized protein n=1 Tax=Adineta ricciae TaxID=249248 RepID=A0A814I1K3_ADIRI|nr:unnamed protein product [Adineta ricciae]CAF1510069.1 unnamed protein product [Adineta ricciae]
MQKLGMTSKSSFGEKTNQQNKSLQIHRCAFDVLLDSFLPSSLLPKDEYDPFFNRSSTPILLKKTAYSIFNQSQELIIPGEKLSLQIDILNPLQQMIKSIRIKLQQYRLIIDRQTDLNVFSFLLPGLRSKMYIWTIHSVGQTSTHAIGIVS